ncbi:predicted protein [Nematostella vectensis]|uniref:Uncharacterized protein n=1 Tax=Nematostella vectensis TaxID=45351 RepID=A7T0D2_NEMVE|nr:predicted protein [Nematostella vectensis]|eukprot:XP_001622680.1 predicted protein [Nematostella vectensis]
MALEPPGERKNMIKGSIKSFKERTAVLQAELKEYENKRREFEIETKNQRVRESRAKQQMQRMRQRMQDIDVKMEKNENKLMILKDRLHQARRRTQDNLETTKFLEGSHVDLEGKTKDIQQAHEYAALMRRKRMAKEKEIHALEDKIAIAERRCTKAEDRAFVIREKLATHRHLQGNPQISESEVYTGNDDMDKRANHLRQKINKAVIRYTKAEKKAANLENKAEVLEISLENYERRFRDFQQSKRELMSSKLF